MELPDGLLQTYLENHCEPEPPVLQKIAHETHLKVLRPHMISGHYQGRLLSFFSKLLQPKAILEIGTFTGYATICLAEGLAENGEIDTIEVNPELEEMLKTNFSTSGFVDKINLYIGEAFNIFPLLSHKIYDIAFIDADKRNNYKYYELILDNIRPGGLILVDNILRKGKILDNKHQENDIRLLREFNDKITVDARVENLILPIRDGLMIIRKKQL
ncbi:O-methyltransferase [Mucilaginibacter arboris]|uniref:Methyltransferase n=1 Tax=Mucilaginibacter arboris TaxID=2682090 RepID=A0A7K1ST50_9SPHI|nr:O-methyltransferase [Mucilaginibacter arboris]MVN20280.1 methyltransferase [Mucilaginibacter arboris]